MNISQIYSYFFTRYPTVVTLLTAFYFTLIFAILRISTDLPEDLAFGLSVIITIFPFIVLAMVNELFIPSRFR